MTLELCANSFESALAAQKAGAHRIELCAELSVGGLTPSFGLIEKVISELTIPAYVLIRPRTGNFTYSQAEREVMLNDILQCKKMGASGIVSGALTIHNEIDALTTKLLLEASEGMDFTFHRAFDWTPHPQKALWELQQMGIPRILTSGQRPTALEGLAMLKELKTLSGKKPEIMPGGGINSKNALVFKEAGFSSIHCSASQKKQTLNAPPKVSMNGPLEDGVVSHSSEAKIREILSKLM